jgi:hypothetical protein
MVENMTDPSLQVRAYFEMGSLWRLAEDLWLAAAPVMVPLPAASA